MAQGMIDSSIFEDLQSKIDEESEIRDKLKELIQGIEKQVRASQALISRAHSTPSSSLGPILDDLGRVTSEQSAAVQHLAEFANTKPYYKYNSSWSRAVQDVITAALLGRWLRDGQLLTLDQVGAALGVPVNVRGGDGDDDKFHVTIEEYLQALISVVDELARLAVNSVTLGDYERPLLISTFVKEVHAGFQLLNLKNDSLRRRSDSIKYSVKKVEDVVYDLSLRNLIPKPDSKEKMETA